MALCQRQWPGLHGHFLICQFSLEPAVTHSLAPQEEVYKSPSESHSLHSHCLSPSSPCSLRITTWHTAACHLSKQRQQVLSPSPVYFSVKIPEHFCITPHSGICP